MIGLEFQLDYICQRVLNTNIIFRRDDKEPRDCTDELVGDAATT